MVKVFKKGDNNEEYYKCEECGYLYKEKEWALKCEKWCEETKSCNLEIISHGEPNA